MSDYFKMSQRYTKVGGNYEMRCLFFCSGATLGPHKSRNTYMQVTKLHTTHPDMLLFNVNFFYGSYM